MKYTVFQLRKLKMPFEVEEEFDLSNDLDGFEDILKSTPAHVIEKISQVSDDTWEIKAHISIVLTLQSSISLKEIPYKVECDTEFEYTLDKDLANDSDAILVENNTIDTTDDSNDKINPAFAGLADLLKK